MPIRPAVTKSAASGVQSMSTCCLAFLPVENIPPPIDVVVATTAVPEPEPFAIYDQFDTFAKFNLTSIILEFC